MRKITLIILTLILFCASSLAIKQKGYVRTVKRPNSVVQRLQGVTIIAKDKENKIVTDDSGCFEIIFDGLHNGELYSLRRIMKPGYELQDKEVIGRAQSCSDIVPFEILMVNREELAREKLKIEEDIRNSVEQEYISKSDQLENELRQHIITEEEYRRRIDELDEKYERFEPLVSDIADRYARADYAGMDSLTGLVNQAIERGDIDEAERLLGQKGDFKTRESQLLSDKHNIERAEQYVDSLKYINETGIRNLADDYYRKYTICLARFKRDSARYFILRRAGLDTTNVEYQLQAAQFLLIYTMENELAIQYDERALRIATIRNGRIYGDVATALNDKAAAYQNMGRLDEAENHLNQALDIRRSLHGDSDKSIAETYNNLGSVAIMRSDYPKAEKYLKKAIEIRQKLTGKENDYEIAKSELNLASLYVKQGKCDKAVKLLGKILPELEAHDKGASTEVANCCNSLGAAYYYLKDYATSVRYFEKAYSILKQIKGDNHQQTRQVEQNLMAVKNLI